MKVYNIGFTKKTAEEFFESLKRAGIKKLIDVRLRNSSQLAGFARGKDLPYFLREICAAEYSHAPELAPTKELLDGYRDGTIDWEEYEERFRSLMAKREIEKTMNREDLNGPTVLLCSEETPEECHRRLILNYLLDKWGDIEIENL